MKALFKGVGLLLLFAAKGVFTAIHVAFSSVYQTALVVSKQLRDELHQLQQRRQDDDF
jgi:hypothetical protein